ncbi:hypothetical protein ACN2XU_08495 [Primorskyibacter sp. 2E107]|uniref:hypothetical protein n=1 Tax=Primorskyibacter sp. 2E107 TaxID=3403458 RepID=UPI003AF981DC
MPEAGAEVLAFLEVHLSRAYLDHEINYGFKKVRVRLRLGVDPRPRLVERLENGNTIADAHLSTGGTLEEPFWEISSPKVLQGDYVTKEGPLAKFAAETGARVTAELSAHLFDGSLDINNSNAASNAKTRIIERLVGVMISDEIEVDGRIKLSSHSIRFEE